MSTINRAIYRGRGLCVVSVVAIMGLAAWFWHRNTHDVLDMHSPHHTFLSLRQALAEKDETSIRKLTTPRGLKALKAYGHGKHPDPDSYLLSGLKDMQEHRQLPNPGVDLPRVLPPEQRIFALWHTGHGGPDLKLEFIKYQEGWKLDDFSMRDLKHE